MTFVHTREHRVKGVDMYPDIPCVVTHWLCFAGR